MSDIRFNRWLHQSGTGGVYQDSTGNIGIGTSVPTSALDVQGGNLKIGSNILSSSGVSTFSSGITIGTGASISSPETNVLALGTNNTEKVRVGAAGSVGIKTSNPQIDLQISQSGGIQVVNTSEIALRYNVYYDGSVDRYIQSSNKAASLVVNSLGEFLFYNTDTASSSANSTISGWASRAKIDSSGRVTTPYQPAFAAYDNTGTTRTSGTVIWNVKLFDRQNNYNTSDGRFTAPVSGVYLFRADFRSNSTSVAPIIDIVTSNGYVTRHEETAGIVNVYHQSLCMVCYMNANDYAYVQVSGGSIRMDTNQVDNFAGYLVG